MIKPNQCAADVQVKVVDGYKPKSLSHKYLVEEDMLYLTDGNVYNDTSGSYVFVSGSSGFNSGTMYLRDLILVNVPKKNTAYIPAKYFPNEGLKWREPLETEEKIDINDFDFLEYINSACFGDLSRVSNIYVDKKELSTNEFERLKKQFDYIYVQK